MDLSQTKRWRVPAFVQKVGVLRRFFFLVERTVPFLVISFSSRGLLHPDGRLLIWGKFRRLVLSSVPPLARLLQKHHGLTGGCQSCGASCQLLFQCPHWDNRSHLCSVYEDRPNICRLFPITPADIRDRSLVNQEVGCGFAFAPHKKPLAALKPQEVRV